MRVVIIDDDPFVTTSLTTILDAQKDIEIVGVGHDGSEACSLYEEHQPDILLMDIQMQEMSGLEAAKLVLAAHPQARIVFLTTFANDDYIVEALRLDTKGYLIKQEVATIAPALRAVSFGQSVMGGEVLGRVDKLMNSSATTERRGMTHCKNGKLAGLSEREYEIFELIAQGLDNKEIAERLFLSEGTVRNHISAILAKLEFKNRTQLAVLYYQS